MPIDTAAIPATPWQAAAHAMRIASILVSNAIALVGVLHLGWSALNVLALYWFENLLGAAFTLLRIAVHRRLTRCRGHWREDPLAASPGGIGSRPALLRDYAIIAVPFTLGHGVVVAGIAIVVAGHHPDAAMWQFDPLAFRNGALMLLLTLAVDFGVDCSALGTRSFAWMKAYVQQRLGRVLALQLAIVAGMIAMALSGSPFALLYALIGLKTLWELATGTVHETAPMATSPPAWMLRAGKRLLDGNGASELVDQWRKRCAIARSQAIEDERPMPQ